MSEYKWRGVTPCLYYSVELTSNLTWITFLTDRTDLSNWTPKITFIILTLGYYWPDLHSEVYIDSFNESNKTKLISWRRNTINTSGISSEVTVLYHSLIMKVFNHCSNCYYICTSDWWVSICHRKFWNIIIHLHDRSQLNHLLQSHYMNTESSNVCPKASSIII